ncbi:export protein [Lactobacillus selangorensis]|uniref:Export protein n=1 Tax=Lactobacillus selangorensis TaxID=81857 RepID=A0A0R2FT84_9LACO|nr:hypothetical protein [Lactobacillus selangorensis]KRN27997.1 export protein [Lactobacillus selangorensis]KRN30532.1 export protein [Lactobacillus selangorensis]
MRTNQFSQFGALLKIQLRRDWVKLLAWYLFICGMVLAVAYKFTDIYGTRKEILAITPTLKSKAVVAMFGAFTLPNKPTTTQIFANEMLVFTAILLIIMNISLAVKNTRFEEDTGSLEMISALPVGRSSNLLSVLSELILINGLLGVSISVGLHFSGMVGTTSTGNWLLGLGLASCGLFFGVIALLCAEVANNASQATTLSYAVFGIAYLLRMMTDISHPRYTWWSLMGWLEKTQPYFKNNWLPLWLYLGSSLVLILIELQLNNVRDLNAGLLPERNGRATAPAWLRGVFSLQFRLNWRFALTWLIVLLLLGASYGSIFKTIGDILKSNPTMQQVFGQGAVNSANHTLRLNFLNLLNVVFAAASTIPALQLMLKLKRDESKGWLESLNATPTSRIKLFSSYLVSGIIVGILAMLVAITGAYWANVAVLGKHALYWTTFMKGFDTYVPIILLMLGLGAVLVGWLPKWINLAWFYLGYGFISIYMDGLLKIPKWAKRLTPYGWTPKVPVKNVNWTQTWLFLAIAVFLIIIGIVGYQRRDLMTER